jgi:hypothetical protein
VEDVRERERERRKATQCIFSSIQTCFRKDEKARREPKSKAEAAASAAVPAKSWEG